MIDAHTLTVYWDSHDRAHPGWYVEVRDGYGDIIVDSLKIWFALEVDWYGENQEVELIADLREAYFGATIIT